MFRRILVVQCDLLRSSMVIMMFEEMGFYDDLDFFCALLKKVDVEVVAPQNQIEPDSMVDDDYSDEEIDVDEPNFDVHD
ncbi:hypothetical protein CQW23_07420 [Capsicum baccatum]|uniref:Uncharacterized protein n=1 Tax=Capsicum baccatum TaxID=33114 RepID=A0A2G2X651_CAPBA|nr:hypothetical protein CQW23_07420 [Capsicum baccatum]